MKIAINLEYEDELIESFCRDKGMVDEDTTEFTKSFLKKLLTDVISAPFIDKIRIDRMQEEAIMNEEIKNKVLNWMVIEPPTE